MKKATTIVSIYIAYVLFFAVLMSFINSNKSSEKPGRRHQQTSIVLTDKY